MTDAETIQEIIETRLAPFVSMAGGASRLLDVPMTAFFEMVTHPDDVLPITLDRWVVSIRDLDLAAGYEVFDADNELLYAQTNLTERFWGLASEDVQVVFGLAVGAYLYVTYTPQGSAEPRTLLLVKL